MPLRSLAFASLLILSGCAPITYLPVAPDPGPPIRSYEIGQSYTVPVGDVILTVRQREPHPTFQPIQRVYPPQGDMQGVPVFTRDQRWTAIAESPNPQGYYIVCERGTAEVPPCDQREHIWLHIMPDGSIGDGWVNRLNRTTGREQGWPDGLVFDRVMEGPFMAELVYSGRSGDTISLMYREYVDDFARAAFTQQLNYDIGQDNTVRFRSVVIEVEDASGSQLSYRVEEDGGLPWVP